MNPNDLLGPASTTNTVDPQSGGNYLTPTSNSTFLQNNSTSSINQGPNLNGVIIDNYNSSLGVQSVYTPPKPVHQNRNIVALIFIIILFILAIGVFWFINRSSKKGKI